MSKKPSQPPESNDKPVVVAKESSYDPLAPIPVPHSEEVNSDSVWALFEDVRPLEGGASRAYAVTTVGPLPDLSIDLSTAAQPLPATTPPAAPKTLPDAPRYEETVLGGPDLPARAEVTTSAMAFEEMPTQARVEHELAIIARHHERIAKAIRVFWGHKGCVEYIEELILNGNDGADHNRAGFKLEVLSALINLASLHTIN